MYRIDSIEDYMKHVGISRRHADPILESLREHAVDGRVSKENFESVVKIGCVAEGFVMALAANPDLYADCPVTEDVSN